MMDSKIAALGSMMKRARKEQGLTQRQLAAATGVGVRFIREIEHGKETCQIGKVLEVASMLGMKVAVDGETL